MTKNQGILKHADIPPVARSPASAQAADLTSQPLWSAQPTSVPSNRVNSSPLDLFPQVVTAFFFFN